MRNKRKLIRGLAIAGLVLVILTGAALAMTQITKTVLATVSVTVDAPEGIEIYLDAERNQIADEINFGDLNVDVFGTAPGQVPVPVWIHNQTFTEIELVLTDDYDNADDSSTVDVSFPEMEVKVDGDPTDTEIETDASLEGEQVTVTDES